MKLTINTAFKNVEVANYILNMAIRSLEMNDSRRTYLNISKTDLKLAKRFMNASAKALVKELNANRL